MSYNYRQDIRTINELVQRDVRAFERMLHFVCATIQQQLETVPRIIRDFEVNSSASTYAFGMKKDTIEHIEHFSNQLHKEALHALQARDDFALLNVFLDIPGIGLAKAGFCAQLFANRVGCIDTHNLKLYGQEVPIRYPKRALPETRARYVREYVRLCKALGGSTSLWARWCHYVHTLRPRNWQNGGDVSYFHSAVIAGGWDIEEDIFWYDLDYLPKFRQVDIIE